MQRSAEAGFGVGDDGSQPVDGVVALGVLTGLGSGVLLPPISLQIYDALTDNEEELRAAHTAIQAVTDILKTDFLSVLDLEAPDRAAGDND